MQNAARCITTNNIEHGVAVALTHLGLSTEPTQLTERRTGPADSSAFEHAQVPRRTHLDRPAPRTVPGAPLPRFGLDE